MVGAGEVLSMSAKWPPVCSSRRAGEQRARRSGRRTGRRGGVVDGRVVNFAASVALTRSGFWSRSFWFAMQVWSPASMRFFAQGWPPGRDSRWRSAAQSTAKPVFRMPPGKSVPRPVSEITERGVIAARCGGRCCATKSWLMPG
jgi:hypothetical protein